MQKAMDSQLDPLYFRIVASVLLDGTLSNTSSTKSSARSSLIIDTVARASDDTPPAITQASPGFAGYIFGELNSRLSLDSPAESVMTFATSKSTRSAQLSPVDETRALLEGMFPTSTTLNSNKLRIVTGGEGTLYHNRSVSNPEFHVLTEDPSSLFWVPAHQHPEIYPAEYEKLLEQRLKRQSASSSSISLANSPTDTPVRSASSSMISSPIEQQPVMTRRLSVVRRRRLSEDSESFTSSSLACSPQTVSPTDDLQAAGSPRATMLKRSKRTKTKRVRNPAKEKAAVDPRTPQKPQTEEARAVSHPAIRRPSITEVKEDIALLAEQNAEVFHLQVAPASDQSADDSQSEDEAHSGYGSENDKDNVKVSRKPNSIFSMVKHALKLNKAEKKAQKLSRIETEISANVSLQHSLYLMSHQKLSNPRSLQQQVLISNMIFQLIQQQDYYMVMPSSPKLEDEKQVSEVAIPGTVSERNGNRIKELKYKADKEREKIARKRERSSKGRRRRPRANPAAALQASFVDPKSDSVAGYLKNWLDEQDDFVVERRRNKENDVEVDLNSDIGSDTGSETGSDLDREPDEEDEKPLGLLFQVAAA